MEVDQSTKDAILSATGPIIGSALAAALVGAAVTALLELIATNDETDTMVGKNGVHPTEQDTSLSKSDVAGSEVGGKLSDDSAKINSGDLEANRTQAQAQSAGANAANNGATAMITDAGASQIETKALNMS
ncbi:MAG: hypothetical protein LBR93_01220 [Treponema sp.]|jgi:hypothetical protein|nr:hypothetical protein [Treponema sp.]